MLDCFHFLKTAGTEIGLPRPHNPHHLFCPIESTYKFGLPYFGSKWRILHGFIYFFSVDGQEFLTGYSNLYIRKLLAQVSPCDILTYQRVVPWNPYDQVDITIPNPRINFLGYINYQQHEQIYFYSRDHICKFSFYRGHSNYQLPIFYGGCTSSTTQLKCLCDIPSWITPA